MKQTRITAQKKEKRHYFLRSLLLAGFTLLLAKLIWTDDINLYLAPRMRGLAYVTLGVLAILTCASFRQATMAKVESCSCSGDHSLPGSWWKSVIVYGLFLLPLLMGFAMPEKILGSEVAEKRGLNLLSGEAKTTQAAVQSRSDETSGAGEDPALSSTEGMTEKQPEIDAKSSEQGSDPQPQSETDGSAAADSMAGETAPAADSEIRERFSAGGFGDFYTDIAVHLYQQETIHLDEKLFLDGLTTLDLFPKEFDGHKLRTMGFVYRQPGFKPNQFVVARFSVSCCTADASVYGILVESPNGSKYETDSWVEVSGTLRLRSMEGFDMLVLEGDSVKAVEAPDDPYVYFNFGTVDSLGNE
ncbi:TIGR03943 family protein [Brevibacillus humidisoli]|uniref:TIGR03943 family putative permease subunit n=1 Tax=Brevibacillus humidisoli TaxID=2895522 RepID=UPI001E4259E2|nr:TIGR03943 family protein [Brevibacillus humidisoli]UFJ43090.1 TIGR03943 family protein [Brevibacillus humidisoli]